MLAAAAIAAPLCEAQQDFSAVELSVLPVQGSVYMIAGAGGNISVQIGDEGVLIVDTQFAPLAPRIMAEIKKLTNRPVRFIVNTHDHPDHVGGNAALAELVAPSSLEPLQMIAHENALARLSNPAQGEAETPPGGLPADSYFTPTKDFHFNGEAVFLYHAPNAHTDGDTIVLFRESDVVSTGDLFTPGGYPFIDRERGGSVQGLIAGLESDPAPDGAGQDAGTRHLRDSGSRAHLRRGRRRRVPRHDRHRARPRRRHDRARHDAADRSRPLARPSTTTPSTSGKAAS